MKKAFIVLCLAMFLLLSISATAEDLADSQAVIESGEEGAVSDSEYINTEKDVAKYSWAYYLAAGVTAAGVTAAAIIISKKQK